MSPSTAFRPEFSADPAVTTATIEALRRRARSRFESLGMPNRSHEEWRFTPLSSLLETPFSPASRVDFDLGEWFIPGCHRLVFVNGIIAEDLCDLPSTGGGVTISAMSQARSGSAATIEAHIGAFAPFEDNAFAALNTAQELEGAFVHLESGNTLSKPLQIIYAATGANAVTYPRTLVVAEANTSATVVESFVGDDEVLMCPVTEVAVGPGADIRHTRLQQMNRAAFHLGALGVHLKQQSKYSLSSVCLGGRLSRLDADIALAGEGAHASLDGLTMVGGRQIGDHHVRVEHAVPNCTSAQRFRSVLSDRGRAVFTGRIVVAEDAQQTDADQSSRSLVLSPDAVAFNNPQLEIYADDVRCTHGSTVGQLDDEALFYLRARGIGKDQAQRLLTRAFAAEVLDRIEVDDIRSRLEQALQAFFDRQTDRS